MAGSVMAAPQKINCRDSVAADKRDLLGRLLRGRGTSEQELLALAQCNISEKYHALVATLSPVSIPALDLLLALHAPKFSVSATGL